MYLQHFSTVTVAQKDCFALQEFLLVSRLGRHMDIVLHLVPQILNGI